MSRKFTHNNFHKTCKQGAQEMEGETPEAEDAAEELIATQPVAEEPPATEPEVKAEVRKL